MSTRSTRSTSDVLPVNEALYHPLRRRLVLLKHYLVTFEKRVGLNEHLPRLRLPYHLRPDFGSIPLIDIRIIIVELLGCLKICSGFVNM